MNIPEDDKILFSKAKKAFTSSRFDDAEELLKEFLIKQPGNPYAFMNITSIYIKKRGVNLSQAQASRVRKAHELYLQAYKCLIDNKLKECRKIILELAKLVEGDDLLPHYASICGELDKELILEIEQLESGEQIMTLLKEGKSLFESGQYDQCIEKMMAILSIDPSHEEAVSYITRATQLNLN